VVTHRSKAVAFGAVSFYVDHFVTGRRSKFTYGVPCITRYNPSDPEHVRRLHKSFVDSMEERGVPGYFDTMLTRVRHGTIFTWLFGLNHIVLQGTKVLEDREIRHSFYMTSEDIPPQHVFSRVVKYTGTLATPEWDDVEEGRVFSFPWYFVKSAQSQKDKFETLCFVEGDLSSAPYTSNLARTGYKREYDIVLLVGLTELKAQVSWIDARTVRAHVVPHVSVASPNFHVREYRGQREGLCSTVFEFPLPKLNLMFRSNAEVVYDNPSERTEGDIAERYFQHRWGY